MAVQLNHTIVASRDPARGAAFLADILGLAPPRRFAHFVTVELANGVSLDYDAAGEVRPQHYAFLVEDAEFDAIFQRVKDAGLRYYAFPGHRQEGALNTRDGGRGFYFDDPDGHHLEILTRPYGSGSADPR